MVKTILKKMLICILIIMMINNFIISNISFAATDVVGDLIETLLGTVVGLLTWPFRLFAIAGAYVLDLLMKRSSVF